MSNWFSRRTTTGPSSSNEPSELVDEHHLGDKTVQAVTKRCLPPRNPPWKVRVEKIKDFDGNKIGTYKVISFKKKKATQLCSNLSAITRISTFYTDTPEINLRHLLFFLDAIKSFHDVETMQPLVDYLEYEYYDEIKIIEEMLKNEDVTFDSLWYVFRKGNKFSCNHGETLVGSVAKLTGYDLHGFGGSFFVEGEFISTTGRNFVTDSRQHHISSFEGLRKVSELKIRPMTDEEYHFLTQRGQTFREVAIGCHYRQYNGNMTFNNGWNVEKFKATGRIMVDPFSYARFNSSTVPANQQAQKNTYLNDDTSQGILEIPDDKVFTTVPTISGFSFTVKRWGEIHVSAISHINFDSLAFSQLVMETERKLLVKSLVENANRSFSDIISNKGGGCIFLLHGPPGTGKTLTAEAIADLLQKPLYSVTVGELGTTPENLEFKLRQILELAFIWDAVLLIDEADIFLERRSNDELQRNALVGIFLRLLEYYQGILFLTSNRVRCFDEAFHSRVSIALRYEPLNRKTRRQVFDNLLNAAGITGIDTKKISKHKLNGRQIKSTIRLAQTLAFTEGVSVSLEHLERTVSIASQFQDELNIGTSVHTQILADPSNSMLSPTSTPFATIASSERISSN